MEHVIKRRNEVKLSPNPHAGGDYVISLAHSADTALGNLEISLRYIPDRHIAEQGSLSAYLQSLLGEQADAVEAIGATIMEDMNNILIPRWIQVHVRLQAQGREHAASFEDRQPRWDNPFLLGRLSPL